MKFSSSARQAEEFDRALRETSVPQAYASELRVLQMLAAADVQADPAFTAELRSSLLEATRAMGATPLAAVGPRRKRRRWAVAAPAAVAALATGGMAFALTGGQSNKPPTAAPASVSALSTEHAALATLHDQLEQGRPTAAGLTTLRLQALHLQDMLIAAYAASHNPQPIRELHEFALAAIAELASLHGRVPSGLAPLYASTLQTLIDIAAEAESTCPSCGLPPLRVPASVAPYVHVATVPAAPSPSGITTPSAPQSVPVSTPSASIPASPSAAATPPAVTPPAVTPILPSPPITLPSALPTLKL